MKTADRLDDFAYRKYYSLTDSPCTVWLIPGMKA